MLFAVAHAGACVGFVVLRGTNGRLPWGFKSAFVPYDTFRCVCGTVFSQVQP
jgi:hypothetical protein